MKQSQHITGAYLDGISEGRSLLSNFPNIDKEQALRNATINMKRHSGAMKDCFRGERDFWRNQLKKGE